MKPFKLGSISKNLVFLVLLAVLPALALFLYNGLEQRQHNIAEARQDVALLTHALAEAQNDIAISTRQLLSTLARLPEVQSVDINRSSAIFQNVLADNPQLINIALTDLSGKILAVGRGLAGANLADRKHIREALAKKTFAAGEYIVTRSGITIPGFPFAYPVLGKNGRPRAVLSTVIRLDGISSYLEIASLPEDSFVAVTDHQGIRLAYYPENKDSNPIGKAIKATSWEQTSKSRNQGNFISSGSDGKMRIIAFETVHLNDTGSPYLYTWAGIPEAYILAVANANLLRNLLLMLLVTLLTLLAAAWLGKNTLVDPINVLVAMTRGYAQGNFAVRIEQTGKLAEVAALASAFNEMADAQAKSQRTLRDNEASFRVIMNSLAAVVYVADMASYEILFINQYGKNRFGDVTGKICWQNLQKGQTGPCTFCTNQYLLDEKGKPTETYTWEAQNTATGDWHLIHDRAIQWIDERIVRLEIATDITTRKRAETQLAEESERLAVTLRSIGDGVITTDTQGQVVLINHVAEALTGWKSEDAAGRPLPEVFNISNTAGGEPGENLIEKVAAAGKAVSLNTDTTLLAKNGQQRRITDSCAPITGKDGTLIGFVLVFRDITTQLRTEQELLKVKKLESVGVLAGGIAHDFNNILAAILGNLELSLRDASLSEKTEQRLSQALNASKRATDLTQQLLTFAKGGQPIKATAALPEVVRDSADFILRGDKVACRYQFADDLWLVEIDKGQISQVVQNVILNASNAMPGGGIIEVSGKNYSSQNAPDNSLLKPGNYVELQIKDSGIGIPENVLDQIFDPYFSTKQQGSGLGLAITHSIINKHGGQISVESTPGVGTTFSIYLPASTRSTALTQKTEQPALPRKVARILVMDDEELVRNVTQEILEEMGHEVLLAKDGLEAVQCYQTAREKGSPIDVIIMDLTVPGGMGGVEAVQKILAIDATAQVIVSSGYSNDPAMANCQDYGFCAALAKPLQFAQLDQTINLLLA